MRYNAILKRINQNKRVAIFISIFMLLVVINLFIYELTFYWLTYSIFMLISGTILLLDSLGLPFKRAFINIDEDRINVRSGIMSLNQSIHWTDILMIEIDENRILLRKEKNRITIIDLKRFPENNRLNMITVISEIAESKDIEVRKQII